MGKFTKQQAPHVRSPIVTTGHAALTHQGGIGASRDPKSELFLLAVSNLVGEKTFYESSGRDRRYQDLIHAVTQSDPDWVRRFLPWLRNSAQMRSATIVGLAEYVAAGGQGSRQLISETLTRADEPAELVAYWTNTYGRALPMPVKRGVAGAIKRLYTERNILKYDGSGQHWRFGDVICRTHPRPADREMSARFAYLVNRRWNHELIAMGDLPMISANLELRALPQDARRKLLDAPGRLAEAGMTWESASEFFGKMDREVWEVMIPNMGYMALLRNLRNFSDAGIGEELVEYVTTKLTDPEEVANSRQFPLRFFSAYTQTGDEWTSVIAKALDLSVKNVPELKGRTLILCDRSGSMGSHMSQRGSMQNWQSAALFGLALAKKNKGRVDLYSYDNSREKIDVDTGSILRTMASGKFEPRGGTETWKTVRATYGGHDRVIILTDEQAWDNDAGGTGKATVYTFNVAGYKTAHVETDARHLTFGGGLTDQAFTLLKILDERKTGTWPF